MILFTKKELEKFTCALSDINCWISGFVNGKEDGDSFLSDVQSELRELNVILKDELIKKQIIDKDKKD